MLGDESDGPGGGGFYCWVEIFKTEDEVFKGSGFYDVFGQLGGVSGDVLEDEGSGFLIVLILLLQRPHQCWKDIIRNNRVR